MVNSVEPKKTGLAKVVAVSAAVFLVSLGLCGANFLALTAGGGMNGSEGFLFVTAYLELAGMAGSAIVLLIIGIIVVFKALRDHFSTTKLDSVSIIEKNEDK